MKRLSLILPTKILLTTYKSFVRPNFDYTDIIYGKSFNESFKRKIKMAQCKAALIIIGAIKGTSHDRLYQELGLESLADRRLSRRHFFFHKIYQELLPSYLQTCNNAVREGAYLLTQQYRMKLSQFPQEPKYLRIHFENLVLPKQ